MTISNRQAGEQGKLGGDVLALAKSEQRENFEGLFNQVLTEATEAIGIDATLAPKMTYDTGEDLGYNPAPGLVSGLLGVAPHDMSDADRASFNAQIRSLVTTGIMTLPRGFDLQVVEPMWPNPTRVEMDQVWQPGPNEFTRHPVVVHDVDSDTALLPGGGVLKAAMLDPANGWRCVGYELPDGKRVMVGEYRQGDAGSGSSVWRVSGILDGARVRLTSPADCASQSEVNAPVESIAKWRIIANNDAGWTAARAESIATVAKMKFEVRETPAPWGELAKQYMFRRWAHRDSNGEVPLIPKDPAILVEREASFGDLRFAYHTLEGTPTAPVIKASVHVSDSHDIMDNLFRLSGLRAPHDLVIPTLGKMQALLVEGHSRASSARPGTMDLTLRFEESRLPKIDVRVTGAESCAAAFQDLIDATARAADGLTSGPTMRAECASSDVVEGKQDRTVSPPDADCGPSFTRPVSPAIQVMIDAGYAVDPSLL